MFMQGHHHQPAVLVVDNSRIMREALVGLLTNTDHLGPVAATDTRLLPLAHAFSVPDVVLLPWAGASSLDMVCEIAARLPQTSVIVIGIEESEDKVLPCIEAGAAGYMAADGSCETLVALIHGVLDGETQAAPFIIGAMTRRLGVLAARHHEPGLGLTHREDQVLDLVAKGLPNDEIAERLGLSVRTVKNHLHSIFTKLGVSRRAEAVAVVHGRPPAFGNGQACTDP
ncbi:response regulator transcription factor [Arthrobacter sp. B0490]|uniref:helix-turn-helix transcriptional regulator n=1 Tax=Arthrobacter sp. B0490 TaxID=2058891 RepID=UPI000CE3269B